MNTLQMIKWKPSAHNINNRNLVETEHDLFLKKTKKKTLKTF